MRYLHNIAILILVSTLFITGNILFSEPTYAAKKKVVFIGSSSFARGCNSSYGFIKLLAKDLGSDYQLDCKNTSEGGTSYDYFLERWQNAAKGKGYDDLVIYAGLNGINSNTGMAHYQTNLDIIFKEAKAEGLRVIVMSAQPYPKGAYATYIPKNNAWANSHPNTDIFIDVYHAVDQDNDGKQDPEFIDDGLHLNAAGNEIQYKLLANQAYGRSFTVSGLQIFDEIELIVQKPQTKISIPGVSFTNPEDLVESVDADGSKYIYFPFLGEYIAAIYKYAIVAIAIMAVIMLIAGGFIWTTSGGSSERVNSAKSKIMHAIVGLFIAVGSYTLLFTINPELVQFRNLKVLTIKGIPIDGVEFISDKAYTTLSGGKQKISQEEALNIAREAAKNVELDECIFVTIVKKESGGAVNAIGHDENVTRILPSSRIEFIKSGKTYSGRTFAPVDLSSIKSQLKTNPDIAKNHPTSKIKNDDGPRYVDVSKLVAPDYGLDWRFTKGHGFGIAQIQIFQSSYCDKSAGIRGRTIGGVCYTIPELLDPVKNMEASARLFKINTENALAKGKTDDAAIREAFRKYNGSGAYADAAMKIYKECKSGSS